MGARIQECRPRRRARTEDTAEGGQETVGLWPGDPATGEPENGNKRALAHLPRDPSNDNGAQNQTTE